MFGAMINFSANTAASKVAMTFLVKFLKSVGTFASFMKYLQVSCIDHKIFKRFINAGFKYLCICIYIYGIAFGKRLTRNSRQLWMMAWELRPGIIHFVSISHPSTFAAAWPCFIFATEDMTQECRRRIFTFLPSACHIEEEKGKHMLLKKSMDRSSCAGSCLAVWRR